MCCGSGYIQTTTNAEVIATLFLIAPQFSSVDPVKLANYQSVLDLIYCQVNQQILKCNSPMILAFLLAHYLTLASNSNLGVYSALNEGDLSLTVNVSPDMGLLNTTPYGRAYIDLIKRTVIGTTVSNLPPVLGGIQVSAPGAFGCSDFGGCGGYGVYGW